MSEKIIVIDDNPQILGVKVSALERAGFKVYSSEHAYHILENLAKNAYGQQPFAIITDTEMPYVSGTEVVIYLSPNTNLEDALIRKAIENVPCKPFYSLDKIRELNEKAKGKYSGRLILTSRQELITQSIDSTLQERARLEFTIFNEALRICDRTFEIDANGIGMQNLIDYLTS